MYRCGTPGCPCITIDFTNMQTTQKSLSVICTVRQLQKWKIHQAELNNETTEEARIAKKWDDFSQELRVRLQKAASEFLKTSSKEVTNCQCVNGPAPAFNPRTAKRKEKTSGVTSVLKSQKLDYDSSPIVNNNIVDTSQSSSSRRKKHQDSSQSSSSSRRKKQHQEE